jgi:Fe-Mn family superoxide dismutase
MEFELSILPFEMNALEPYISAKTLEYHHGKHHKAYMTNLNTLIQGTRYKNSDLETIIKIADGAVFNYAAQVWNHNFYFDALKPSDNHGMSVPFADIINESFGSVLFLKETFVKSALSLFGSGWVWLVLNPKGTMEIVQKNNAGNPLRIGLIPLLTCDVWEHAYYLDYQHRRSEYIESFWRLINWELVEKRYHDAIQ